MDHHITSRLPLARVIRPLSLKRPERPECVTEDCEKRVIEFLQKERVIQENRSKNNKSSFRFRFDKITAEIDKLVIRAASFISANTAVGPEAAKTNPSQYPTIFGCNWANVMKGKNVKRRPVEDFAKSNEKYLLWMVSHGPSQPQTQR